MGVMRDDAESYERCVVFTRLFELDERVPTYLVAVDGLDVTEVCTSSSLKPSAAWMAWAAPWVTSAPTAAVKLHHARLGRRGEIRRCIRSGPHNHLLLLSNLQKAEAAVHVHVVVGLQAADSADHQVGDGSVLHLVDGCWKERNDRIRWKHL